MTIHPSGRSFVFLLVLTAAIAAAAGRASFTQAAEPSDRWEPAIRAFEQSDANRPPPLEGILFVGSSSIRGWDLDKYFPGLPAINRGFGGSQVIDSVRFADRIVLPYRPRVILLYAGDNDVAKGKKAEQVLADYRAFVAKVHAALPETRIEFIAIKPSIARWSLVGEMRKANRLIREVTETNRRLGYIDVDTPMIAADGRPRPELFAKDGLHLNADGYKLWSDLVRPRLRSHE